MKHLGIMNHLIKNWTLLFLTAIPFFVAQGCEKKRELRQPSKAYPGSIWSYGAGDTLDARAYDAITLRLGDTVFLQYPFGIAMLEEKVAGIEIQQVGPAMLKIVVSKSAQSGVNYQIRLKNSDFVVSILAVSGVWPGDTDSNGVRNILDFYPVLLGIRGHVHGFSGNTLHYPPILSEMAQVYQVEDWMNGQTPLEFTIGNRTINFKHADCNLDGHITLEDAEYVMAALTPLLPSDLLTDYATNIHLAAVLDSNWIPNPIPVSDASFGLVVPFKIKVDNVPAGIDSLFALAFSRNVTETPFYNVLNTVFSLTGSNLFLPGDQDYCWQKFWDLINIQGDSVCAGVVDKPLDVFIGDMLEKAPVYNGALGGTCDVVLDDIMRFASGNFQPFLFYMHTMNGVAYTIQQGQVTGVALTCTSDSTLFDASILCGEPSKPILRDGYDVRSNLLQVGDSGYFSSRDICIRHTADGIWVSQNPRPGKSEVVYVRVFNKGCDTLKDVYVQLYQSMASTAETWPGDFEILNNGVTGVIIIPEIPPMDTAIGRCIWNVPSPDINITGGIPCFSLLAIASSKDDGDLSEGNIREHVIHYGNVAMLSSFNLMSSMGPPTAVLTLANPGSNPVNLTLTQIEGPALRPASNYGHIELRNLPLSGCSLTNMAIQNEIVHLVPNSIMGRISNLNINQGSPIQMGIRFNQTGNNYGGPLHYRYKLTMETNGIIYNSTLFEITIAGMID